MKLRVAFNDSFSGLIYSAGEFGNLGSLPSLHSNQTTATLDKQS